MTSKTPDDLEAVRAVAERLQDFSSEDRQRIIRWALEKLGTPPPGSVGGQPGLPTPPAPGTPSPSTNPTDIRGFVTLKSPKSDIQFAATVAYFHQFVAPVRKGTITSEDLIDACRQVSRRRPQRPAQVLVNAFLQGILDRGKKGEYKLNSVGENLVAMTLPDTSSTTANTSGKTKAGARRSTRRKRVRRGRG
jgi:hypothetical protein